MSADAQVQQQVADKGPLMWVWVLAVSVAVVATGMAYSLWWSPIVRHNSGWWLVPGDIWYSVRTAHWIGWGSLSFVYSNNHSELITLPGFEVLLTPFVLLSSALGLTESAPGLFPNVHPQAWLLFGPVSMATAGLALWSFDSIARRMQVSVSRRRLLTVLEAGALWSTVVFWGHPEDVLAVGLFVLALDKLFAGRDAVAGWLLGGAIAMQLFTVFAIPVLVCVIGYRRGAALLARAAVIPGFLFIAVTVPDPHDALRTLLQQPAFPAANHVTPWELLSPKLLRGYVAGGPARAIGFLGALVAGGVARARRHDAAHVVWFMSVALGARCVFDPVMVSYYVMPVVTLALLAAGNRRSGRFALTVAAGAALTVMTFTHHGMWTYWVMMTAIMATMLGLAWPSSRPKLPTGPSSPMMEEPTFSSPVVMAIGSSD